MRISFIIPPNNFLQHLIPELNNFGCEILVNRCDEYVNYIIGMSISQIDIIRHIHYAYPKIPMINYNWDMYGWIFDYPRGYDWDGYGQLLSESIEVWAPSHCTNVRMKEFFNLNHGVVIKTFTIFFEPRKIEDKRFVFNPLMPIPDKNAGWFAKACIELGIRFLDRQTTFPREQYENAVAYCSFLVCPWYEASTGGLSLLEGYNLGKPVLISDSPYMGAKDYFGDRAIYFKCNDYNDFKLQIKNLWENTPKLDIQECKEFCSQYNAGNMARQMVERLKVLNYK